jgi:hypothetical protein
MKMRQKMYFLNLRGKKKMPDKNEPDSIAVLIRFLKRNNFLKEL